MSNPLESAGSTFADPRSALKVRSKGRSDVRSQASGRVRSPAPKIGQSRIRRAWVEAEPKDVGDQALMRGLVTAFPIMRPGLFLSYCGRRSLPATKRLTDIPLPWSRLRPCAIGDAVDYGLAALASLETAHMKPASSRAIAVQTTVVFLPRPLNARYRAVSRVWAFHAISRTFEGACSIR